MAGIDEFYIITETGNCIYSKSRTADIDQTLFAGFMTALNTFSNQLARDNLNAFSLGKSKYFIVNANKLLFVARTDIKEKEKSMQKTLEEMQEIFFKRFKSDKFAGKWDGDVSIFTILDADYARFLLDPEEKMKSSIW
ncbi:MAG: hypothetical protein RBG13Loki_1235 [Promethearchaeota archaeon CR_4]|nr:MAG: hypothetical protein RBG13Loki_1235 [Candidatus Lokiarchaeota archaeon CR_4]